MDSKGQYCDLFNMQAEGFLDRAETSSPVKPAEVVAEKAFVE